jgi:hypothetical protein
MLLAPARGVLVGTHTPNVCAQIGMQRPGARSTACSTSYRVLQPSRKSWV